MQVAGIRSALLLAVVAIGALIPATAGAAPVSRFDNVVDGAGIVTTGNTLGLNKAAGQNNPGTAGSIGAFTTTDTSLQANNFPAGTTLNWERNSSTAQLQLPDDAVVVYAELIWGGSYRFGGQDLTAQLDTPVSFGRGALTETITPATATASTLTGTSNYYYVRSADVTDFVRSRGEGSFAVGGVPATVAAAENNLNTAGWALSVVYERPNERQRWAGLSVGAARSGEPAFDLGRFCTPQFTSPTGSVTAVALEGDANIRGDGLIAGPTGGPLTNLSGPNNPATNFFASQLNGPDGTLDQSGTFGTVNSNAQNTLNVSGARQGWDVTNVQTGAAQLGPNQQGLTVQPVTDQDIYVLAAAGAAADIASAYVIGSITGPATLLPGDSTTIQITLNNAGASTAENLVVGLPIPNGLTVSTVTINGNNVTADPATGIALGNLSEGDSVSIQITVQSSAEGDYELKPVTTYDYHDCGGANFFRSDDYELPPYTLPVNKATPSFTAAASGGGDVGTQLTDTATVGVGANPGGTIDFELYGPDDATCSGAPVYTDQVSVTGPGPYTSGSFAPAAAGTYRWRATYSGDSQNDGANTACTDADQDVTLTAVVPPNPPDPPDPPDPPTPPTPPAPIDVDVNAKQVQKVNGKAAIEVDLTARSDVRAVISGRCEPEGSRKSLALKRQDLTLKAGETLTVKIVPKKNARLIERALRRGRKVVANLNVRLYGDGTYEQRRLRVRLR